MQDCFSRLAFTGCRKSFFDTLMRPAGRTFTEQLLLSADAPAQQTAKCSMLFSAAEKKGRLVKPPVAMYAFHIFLHL